MLKLLPLLSFSLGLIYLYFIETSILKTDASHFVITSKIEQNKSFHIRRENNQSTLQCNTQNIIFSNQKKRGYWYHGTESIDIMLHNGKNMCHGTHLTGEIAQKLNFTEFIVLFMLMGVPIFHLLFTLLIWLLNRVWKKELKEEENA